MSTTTTFLVWNYLFVIIICMYFKEIVTRTKQDQSSVILVSSLLSRYVASCLMGLEFRPYLVVDAWGQRSCVFPSHRAKQPPSQPAIGHSSEKLILSRIIPSSIMSPIFIAKKWSNLLKNSTVCQWRKVGMVQNTFRIETDKCKLPSRLEYFVTASKFTRPS